MPKIILTYDIDGQHVAYKARLKSLAYSDQIDASFGESTGKMNLPNTTMYHENKTVEGARDEAKNLALSMGIDMERCLVIEIGEEYAGIRGDFHSE